MSSAYNNNKSILLDVKAKTQRIVIGLLNISIDILQQRLDDNGDIGTLTRLIHELEDIKSQQQQSLLNDITGEQSRHALRKLVNYF